MFLFVYLYIHSYVHVSMCVCVCLTLCEYGCLFGYSVAASDYLWVTVSGGESKCINICVCVSVFV